ncbi:hypothetical protein KIN34_10635 [Cellulomonas sp. DKR-3]|uniref:DUF7847 domain-containing protein n=1 Tax=Cellulomonas fulva TaxID=2835530 RepID=A0ABS5U006_9CELL|nr:hypothetical protein [Cellulomonas fulva]MBT0994740.1 hypothetical protein [Cellulomonas fulva]
MSDTTPRPEDENAPVPPADGGSPQPPESPLAPSAPAAPAEPTGAYPPPPAQPSGAYPPPASPPPPAAPAPGGYGAPDGQPVDVMQAFTWGWKKFTENVGPILLGILGYLVATAIIVGVLYAVLAATLLGTSDDLVLHDDGSITYGSGPNFFVLLVVGGLITLVTVVLFSILQAGFVQAALRLSRGEALSVDTFYRFRNLGAVVVAALLVGVLTAVGYALCYLPGIAVAFFAQFTLYYVVDRGLGAVDALKASFELVKNNLGPVALLSLGIVVVSAVGSLLCGVGLFVALPLALLAQAYFYRRLNGEPVAA